MKILVTLFVLFFSLSLFADDIYDFQIEGISINDSALEFFSEIQIKENSYDYNNKKYIRVQNDNLPFFKTYDAVDFNYKAGDKEFKIVSLSGVLIYENNIEECYPKLDVIIKELENNLNPKNYLEKETWTMTFDPSGKSKATDAVFIFDSGIISVSCFDYSDEYGDQDHLSVSIDTNEFDEFLRNEAYD